MSYGSQPPSWSGSLAVVSLSWISKVIQDLSNIDRLLKLQDQAICGIGAGVVSTLCMHPLDRVKVQFQVARTPGQSIFGNLQAVLAKDGLTGLYRGLNVNIIGNSASWGFYFLWCDSLYFVYSSQLRLVQVYYVETQSWCGSSGHQTVGRSALGGFS